MHPRCLSALAILATLFAASTSLAQASLEGTQIGVSVTGDSGLGTPLNILTQALPTGTTSTVITVGPGVDFVLGSEKSFIEVPDDQDVDIVGNSIFFAGQGSSFQDYGSDTTLTLTGLDWAGTAAIHAVDFEFANGFGVPLPSLIGFTPGDTSLVFDFGDIPTESGNDFQVHLTPTPEPTSLAVLLGLGGLFVAGRRQHRDHR